MACRSLVLLCAVALCAATPNDGCPSHHVKNATGTNCVECGAIGDPICNTGFPASIDPNSGCNHNLKGIGGICSHCGGTDPAGTSEVLCGINRHVGNVMSQVNDGCDSHHILNTTSATEEDCSVECCKGAYVSGSCVPSDLVGTHIIVNHDTTSGHSNHRCWYDHSSSSCKCQCLSSGGTTCAPCGAKDDPVCNPGFPAFNNANSGCNKNFKAIGGICSNCGGTGQVPCDMNHNGGNPDVMSQRNEGCDSHHIFNTGTSVCDLCGHAGNPICNTGFPASIDPNSGCNNNLKGIGGICSNCGGTGEVPCVINRFVGNPAVMSQVNDGCDSHHIFNTGTSECDLCGHTGTPVCNPGFPAANDANSGCNNNLSASNGQCS